MLKTEDRLKLLVPATKNVMVVVGIGGKNMEEARLLTEHAYDYLLPSFPDLAIDRNGIITLKYYEALPLEQTKVLSEEEKTFVEQAPGFTEIFLREEINYTAESEQVYWASVLAQKASARYYLCYFRQEQESVLDGSDGAPITQRFVHKETFTPEERAQAVARANELEQELHARNDYNVRIVARLAASLEDAKEGRFLDG